MADGAGDGGRAVFELAEGAVSFEGGPMGRPFGFRQGIGQFPAALAEPRARCVLLGQGEASGPVQGEAEIGVLFPVPVGGEIEKAAARLRNLQGADLVLEFGGHAV